MLYGPFDAGLYDVEFLGIGICPILKPVAEACEVKDVFSWIRLDRRSYVSGTCMEDLAVTPCGPMIAQPYVDGTVLSSFPFQFQGIVAHLNPPGSLFQCDCGADKHNWPHDFSCQLHHSKVEGV